MKKSEHGQALILLVMAVVGMLGFTALAIDGGMIYSDRRITQNAADAASLAGAATAGQIIKGVKVANWNCGSGDVASAQTEAIKEAGNSANSNDFPVSSGNVSITTACNNSEKYIDVKVEITKETQTAFAHFVFGGSPVNTVYAVARVYGQDYFGGGNAIIALKDTCTSQEGGVTFGGTISVTVTGGNVYSNACLVFQGTPGKIDASGGDIFYITDIITTSGKKEVNPDPTKIYTPLELPAVDDPDCENLPDINSPKNHSGSGILDQGNYNNIKLSAAGGDLTLNPGLYCIHGDLVINGGTFTANDVTFFFPKDAGKFSTAGGAVVDLSAPPPGCELDGSTMNCPPSIGGMLIYYLPEYSPSSGLFLGGTSGSSYTGTIYAPNSTIDVQGDAFEESPLGAQLIGRTVDIHGTTDINIQYQPENNFPTPPHLRLQE